MNPWVYISYYYYYHYYFTFAAAVTKMAIASSLLNTFCQCFAAQMWRMWLRRLTTEPRAVFITYSVHHHQYQLHQLAETIPLVSIQPPYNRLRPVYHQLPQLRLLTATIWLSKVLQRCQLLHHLHYHLDSLLPLIKVHSQVLRMRQRRHRWQRKLLQVLAANALRWFLVYLKQVVVVVVVLVVVAEEDLDGAGVVVLHQSRPIILFTSYHYSIGQG